MPRHDQEDIERTCSQCPVPTNPSQCAHTREGRDFLKQQRSLHEMALGANPLQYWSNVYPTSPQRIPNQSPAIWASPSPLYAVTVPNRPSFVGIDPLLLAASQDSSTSCPGLATENISGPSNSPVRVASTATSEAGSGSTSSAQGEDVISSSENDTSSVSGHSGSRVRVTKKNPIHGLVVGAMRGGRAYDIVRSKPLRNPIASQAEASARFLRCATDIMERCERMSNETGCWLYFTAQHLFAHAPFLHYASPRLLKEGKKDTEQLTNHFNKLFATLIALRNEESKDMHKRLLSAEDDKKAATEALAAAQDSEREAVQRAQSSEQQVEAQREELEAHQLQIEALKAQLRVAERKSRIAE
ncbi:hypothetical protein R3P38DRAFT_3252100 [Favolaschia claudopus]|uniref:Uncharacterized protein n=1 Tax=Favolaschia claudopus TaxID=2862362 RepID=A0AAW0EA52_9AGAR